MTKSRAQLVNNKNDSRKISLTVKSESLEEYGILDQAGDSSIHYDVLVTAQEVQCKLCSRIFKNNYNLLKHNNEHLKIAIYTIPGINEANELHKHECRDKCVNNNCNILAHVGDIHRKKQRNSKLCEKHCKTECVCVKQFNVPISLHQYNSHQQSTTIKNTSNDLLQCGFCQKLFKMKRYLVNHVKNFHYDYSQVFECRCGKQFRSPIQLHDHKRQKHSTDIRYSNNDQYQCDSCQKIFKVRRYLIRHIKNVHYDYGKMFECWCGKQFRIPIVLYHHQRKQHGIKNTYHNKFQCDTCQKVFKNKDYLINHIKNIHYDYGKVFECWCEKQFRSPKLLYQHKQRQHRANIDNTNNNEFQCDFCHKFFKTKHILTRHQKNIHYDYGKVFECSCGKEFRSPRYLYMHRRRQHGNRIRNKSNGHFQCDSCHKIFGKKLVLLRHIKGVHYDYGKVFECFCGKQFLTPLRLYQHNRRQHL